MNNDMIKIEAMLNKNSIICVILENYDHSEIIELIKDIDDAIAEWEFTLALVKHFKFLEQQYNKEEEQYDKEALSGPKEKYTTAISEDPKEEKRIVSSYTEEERVKHLAEINAQALVEKNRVLLSDMIKHLDASFKKVDIEQEKLHWRRVFVASSIQGGRSIPDSLRIADNLIETLFD